MIRFLSALILLVMVGCSSSGDADLVLRNAAVYTMEEAAPWASAVVIKGNQILAVLEDEGAVDEFIGPETRVVDLDGAFVLPGFIDGHVHFDGAGRLLRDANLLRVSDDDDLRAELSRVVAILPEGEWITGGNWGAYEEWAEGAAAAGAKQRGRWEPTRQTIDSITPANPVFVNSFERALYLADTAALEAAGLLDKPVDGMRLDGAGKPTGLIDRGSPAIEKLRAAVKPKSEARLLDEGRAALKRLAESGIVEVHDITGDEQMELYVKLQEMGELTTRVWMRADLSRASEFNERGIKLGNHPKTGQPDPYLRWGAYKGYIDGIMGNHTALFYDPYDDQPDNYGAYRHHTSDDPGPDYKNGNMQKMYDYLLEAHRGGFPANVHAIGTKGTALMLDTYEKLKGDVGGSLEGYRVIHCQVVRPQDFARFQEIGVIAEINPFHLSDDMRWMEERIGKERSKGAYAFQSLLDNGTTLVFGSDWPGTNAAWYHTEPKYLIHAAVTRTTVNHTPEGGWFPEQKISMEEALKAYTINAARAAFNGDTRGSLKAGKLADITVLDHNLMEIDPSEILETKTLMTIVDGRVVYE
jgi:predicted amidohydrolase YtcJ